MKDKRLRLHGRQYWYNRSIPTELRDYFPDPFMGKTRYMVRLATSDLSHALTAKPKWDALFELELAKARKLKAGGSRDHQDVREIEAIALQLKAIAEGDGSPEEATALPDEVYEQALQGKPEPLKAAFWHTLHKGKAALHVSDRLDQWLAHTSGLKQRTLLERRTAIERFATWIGQAKNVADITREDARNYQQHVSAGRAHNTINKIMQALGLYWQYLADERLIADRSIWEKLQRKKTRGTNPDELERPFTDDEIVKLLTHEKIKQVTDDFIRTGLLTGGRLSEIGGLRVRHVDLKQGIVFLPGEKTLAAPRYVPLHADLKAIFTRRVKGKGADAYLFEELPDETKLKHGRSRAAAFSQAFTNYRRRVGVDERVEGKRRALVNFHSTRRWLTTKLTEADTSDTTIDSMLGWKRQGQRSTYSAKAALIKAMRAALEKVRIPPLRHGALSRSLDNSYSVPAEE